MLENKLIEYCAPTLAGMKSASLFNYYFTLPETVFSELKEVNDKLNKRGVFIEILLWKANSVLIYTYRRSHLIRDLKQKGVQSFISIYGYKNCEIESCITHLKERFFHYNHFPHEIGIFLGYPFMDVLGFILHQGKDCKYCGLWKVYSNEQETKKRFEKLQRCTNIYQQVFETGRSITQMTIHA